MTINLITGFPQDKILASSKLDLQFMVIGQVKGKLYSGVMTYRANNIRLILVRSSCDDVVKVYEN